MARFESRKRFRKLFRTVLKSLFPSLVQYQEVDINETYSLSDGKKIKAHIRDYPFEINLHPDGKVLHLYPEPALDCGGDGVATNSYILFDPDIFYSDICGFYRLQDEDEITLGGGDPENESLKAVIAELEAVRADIHALLRSLD